MTSEKSYKFVYRIKNDSHNPGKGFQYTRNLGQKNDVQRFTSQSAILAKDLMLNYGTGSKPPFDSG